MPLQLKMHFENTSNCVLNTPGHCFILGQEVYWTLASKSIGIIHYFKLSLEFKRHELVSYVKKV